MGESPSFEEPWEAREIIKNLVAWAGGGGTSHFFPKGKEKEGRKKKGKKLVTNSKGPVLA